MTCCQDRRDAVIQPACGQDRFSFVVDALLGNFDRHNAPADAGLSAALAAMRPRIAALDIAKTVGNVSYLTDLQRQFYVTYLSARRDRLFGAHVG